MKRLFGVVLLLLAAISICGCNDKKVRTADIVFENGVAMFQNDDFTLEEILKNCDTALRQYFDAAEDCYVAEAYIFTEPDGKLLTKCKSEFELLVVNEAEQQYYSITAEEDMQTICIQPVEKNGQVNTLMPWDKLLDMISDVDFAKIPEEDDTFVQISLSGYLTVSKEEPLTTRYNMRYYLIQSGKMVEKSPEEIEGEGYALFFFCSKDPIGEEVNHRLGMSHFHGVGVLG